MKQLIFWLFWPKPENNVLIDAEQIALILANLLPIAGIFFLKWDSFPILLLYCIEGAISIIIEFIFSTRKDTTGMPLMASIGGFLMAFMIFVVFQIAILVVVFTASDRDQVWQPIRNCYFAIITVVTLAIQSFTLIINSKKRINKNQGRNILKPILFLYYPFIKQALLFLAIVIVVLTGSYKLSLTLLVLFKVFLETRSYLRMKTGKAISPFMR
jgi:hypothetical protein